MTTIDEAHVRQHAAATRTRPNVRPTLCDMQLDSPTRRFLVAVLTAFGLLRLWAMFAVPFSDTTEARYGEIARKMVETGNWLTPQFDYGVPFWGKPPLHTWLSAGGMQLFGVNEAAARLPILLTALAVLFLVWLWVRDTVGRNTALVAMTVLATMAMFFGASSFVMTDMPMVLCTTLVMVGFWQAVGDGNRRWGYGVFLGLAIGMLAKGPVAVVLSGIPLMLWLALTWNWHLLRLLPWARGMALLIALVAPWYVAAEIATPGFLRYFLIGEHVQRFLTPGWQGDLYGSGHREAKGMIWLFWLMAALPWSLVATLLLTRLDKTVTMFRQDRSGWLVYLLLWALSPLLLFTPASNILAAYVLPGLPAAAVLLVVLFTQVFEAQPSRATRTGFAIATSVIFAFFLALISGAVFAPQKIRLKSDKRLVAAASTAMPDAPLYTLGGRSYSAEFYSRGKARAIDPADFARLAGSGASAAFSVPPTMALEAATLGLENLGEYGRHVLFVTRPTNEVK
ncbi:MULTISPECIES: ArnT family glycosyltransferase [unclassified Paracoccus (in: a-proteobacteria)]|uniref:ArnT family glycosyltransferase n=1 Tax=unclassified Paracoccus (in: a-proteobacteria) TaxID=2688777 RepID=UPI0021E50FE5|nr:glycosyltransferase family 39 protein [Paracoccus sp. DMF]MCV2449059.1 glycosyltransferase family 39 protein [Paracoccus sp. DMF]